MAYKMKNGTGPNALPLLALIPPAIVAGKAIAGATGVVATKATLTGLGAAATKATVGTVGAVTGKVGLGGKIVAGAAKAVKGVKGAVEGVKGIVEGTKLVKGVKGAVEGSKLVKGVKATKAGGFLTELGKKEVLGTPLNKHAASALKSKIMQTPERVNQEIEERQGLKQQQQSLFKSKFSPSMMGDKKGPNMEKSRKQEKQDKKLARKKKRRGDAPEKMTTPKPKPIKSIHGSTGQEMSLGYLKENKDGSGFKTNGQPLSHINSWQGTEPIFSEKSPASGADHISYRKDEERKKEGTYSTHRALQLQSKAKRFDEAVNTGKVTDELKDLYNDPDMRSFYNLTKLSKNNKKGPNMEKSRKRVAQDYARNAIVDREEGRTKDAKYEQKQATRVAAGEAPSMMGHNPISKHMGGRGASMYGEPMMMGKKPMMKGGENVIVRDAKSGGKNQYNKRGK